ncbi:hypothetical protein HBB16_15555 [Pseudonocardia sp. MCCB 268]|nr:hypothetical protein [Pseudonocardia cytotoxica]
MPAVMGRCRGPARRQGHQRGRGPEADLPLVPAAGRTVAPRCTRSRPTAAGQEPVVLPITTRRLADASFAGAPADLVTADGEAAVRQGLRAGAALSRIAMLNRRLQTESTAPLSPTTPSPT